MSEKQVALLASVVALVLAAVAAAALVIAFAAQGEATKSATDLALLTAKVEKQETDIAQLTSSLLAMTPILEAASGVSALDANTGADQGAPAEAGALLAVAAPAADETNAAAAPSAGRASESTAEPAPKAAVQPLAKVQTQPEALMPETSENATKLAEGIVNGVPVKDARAADTQPEKHADTSPLKSVDDILAQRIIANWLRPASAKNGMTVDIVIQMSRAGSIDEVKVVKSSGDKAFDASATGAILNVKSVPEMSRVSDQTYKELYKERRVRFRPEDLAG